MDSPMTGGYASLKWLEAGIRGEVWFGTYNSGVTALPKTRPRLSTNPTVPTSAPSGIGKTSSWQRMANGSISGTHVWVCFSFLKEFPEEVTALHSQTSAELWVGAKTTCIAMIPNSGHPFGREKVSTTTVSEPFARPKPTFISAWKKAPSSLNANAKPWLRSWWAAQVKALEVQAKQLFGWAQPTPFLGLYLRVPNSPSLYSLGYREGLPGDRFETLLLDQQKAPMAEF